ncbi:MAG TPA: CoA transferase, partial [Dehalococcoidia bacterium]|nr:CoA transferase [Dehalococcoidia bacterium]
MSDALPFPTPGPRPLDGYRVLDLASILAGPVGATLFAEFGAEVIKVEMPGRGDILRTSAPGKDGVGFTWLTEGRNKKSITLDLRRPQGQAILKRLVGVSDVVFENFRPGTLERWNVGWEDLRQVNPSLIMVRVSGYGQTGPYHERAGYDRIGMGFAGAANLIGFPDRPPLRPGPSLCDYSTALFGAFGGVLALLFRERRPDRPGQFIDVALYESMFRFLEWTLPAYSVTGQVRERTGNFILAAVPGDNFLTRDGKWVSIACVGDRVFALCAQAIGRPEWATDPRYQRQAERIKNRADVDSYVTEWVASHTQAEVLAVLEEHGVPAGPVYRIDEIAADPHYAARENIVRYEHPRVGPVLDPLGLTLITRVGRPLGPADRLGAEGEDAIADAGDRDPLPVPGQEVVARDRRQDEVAGS